MRLNENALKHTAKSGRVDKEGRLQYKPPKESYRQRWFKLKGNLLFYFRTNDMGQQSEFEPLGMIFLEKCLVQLQPMSDHPFVFSIDFDGDGGRLHYFSCSTQEQCEEWVTSLTKASIEFMKAELMLLQNRIQRQTGRDPVDVLYRRQSKHMLGNWPAQAAQVNPGRIAPPPPVAQRVPSRVAPPPPQKPVSQSHFFNSDVPLLSFDDFSTQQNKLLQPSEGPWCPAPQAFSQQPPTNTAQKPSKDVDGWELFE